MGGNDFFLGFAGHAHTMNEMEIDEQRELGLRRRNSPEEAQKLTGMILDKLEKDISDREYSLEDVKLLILYLSYRGEPAENDTLICGSILRTIERNLTVQCNVGRIYCSPCAFPVPLINLVLMQAP